MKGGVQDFAARGLDLRALAEQWMDLSEMVPGPGTLPLAVQPYGPEEVAEAIATLLDGRLTMGPKVATFERLWAAEVGAEHCVMVNSGSSALLVMLNALVALGRLRPGDEVIVPAVTWSTSLFSVAQAGLRPVLVDVHPDSLCLEGSFDRPVLAVHLLGQPARVQAPLVLEDACGAHGARIGEQPVGSIGSAAAFSFFFSHHLTTGEGGAIPCSDAELADACRSVRAHGWTRERSDRAAQEASHAEIDPRFLFVTSGFNLRPTELAGAFGIHQVPRLRAFVQQRNDNHLDWCAAVADLGLPLRVFPQRPGTTHSGFAFPMLLDADSPLDRAELCRRLEARGVQTHLRQQPGPPARLRRGPRRPRGGPPARRRRRPHPRPLRRAEPRLRARPARPAGRRAEERLPVLV